MSISSNRGKLEMLPEGITRNMQNIHTIFYDLEEELL